ncbi:MAG: HAD family hydrolase, partial [Ligilactobacillus sp.]|nr:HAD family hydrolase [Ligilactobacillus sp.]
LTVLTQREKDIFIKHLWGASSCPPKYPEGYIVSLVDKYSATEEYSKHLSLKLMSSLKHALGFAKVSE